jgi:hypothetical protein
MGFLGREFKNQGLETGIPGFFSLYASGYGLGGKTHMCLHEN